MAKQRRGRMIFLLPLVLLVAALLFLRPGQELPGEVATPAPTVTPTPNPYENEKAQLDPAWLEEGVVALRYTGDTEKRVKAQITRSGGMDYNYDLNSAGEWESFSLTDGEGDYTIRVLEQKENGRYTPVFSLSYALTLADPKAPFLASTQFVSFGPDTQTVALAAQLAEGAESDGEKIDRLFTYVTTHMTYDMTQAQTVEKGYVPDPDAVLERGQGICVDYATVLCAMLRSQGIPCKLVMGNAGTDYHAWVEVWCETEGLVRGRISLAAGDWTLLDPTFLSGEEIGEEIWTYVTTPANYQVKFVY